MSRTELPSTTVVLGSTRPGMAIMTAAGGSLMAKAPY